MKLFDFPSSDYAIMGEKGIKGGNYEGRCNHQEDDKRQILSTSLKPLSTKGGGREDILTSYFQEQENRERDVLVAESDGFVAGYITILPAAAKAPFVGVYPELSDFNVFEPFRNRGIGNQPLRGGRKRVRLLSEIVTLGVGFTLGLWPSSQRLYVKRGLAPLMDLEFV